MQLPDSYELYTDVYFLRSLEILQKLQLNPFVRAQVFLRGKPGKLFGITEAVEIIKKYSPQLLTEGRVSYLPAGEAYEPGETILLLEGKIQDIIFLETMLLGVISAETTKKNDHHDVDLSSVTQRIKNIVDLVPERPVYYFGARHWRYDQDAQIAKAAFAGGVSGASTDAGAATAGKKGIGTIPHSLENIFAWKYGYDRAVVETTKSFDAIIDPSIPRIALVDYANKEIDDTLQTAQELGTHLTGIRVDTGGENVMQGAEETGAAAKNEYWYGKGVTISGVYSLRKKLQTVGLDRLQITLSSGFGDVKKVQAFVDAEKELGVQLFDSLGVGNVFDSRISTMDIVGVGDSLETLQSIAKVGRTYKPNTRLVSL